MRVLVCGGRDYGEIKDGKSISVVSIERHWFNHVMGGIEGITEIISGGAKGADRLAEQYAIQNKLRLCIFKADWDKYGKSAGYIRNTQMLTEGKPDLVIAFPGGRGTAMMIDIAKKAGVKVIEIERPQGT